MRDRGDANGVMTRRQWLGTVGVAGAATGLSTTRWGELSALAATSGGLKVAYGAIGSSRHPHSAQIIPDDDINNLLFEPLLTLTAQGAVEPVLARQYTQVGDTRWRFSLRPGVTFHDGTRLTAQDVKFSIENFLKPGFDPDDLYRPWLDHVDIVDDLTVEVVARMPHRVAMRDMAYNSHVIPRTATDSSAFTRRLVGTGPYRFVEFVPNDRVIVEANPTYWGRLKPIFREIVFRQIAEDGTRLAALEAGEVDVATNVPVDAINRLGRAGLQIKSVPSNRVMFVRFNLAVDGPIRDVRVRRALNHAVDRDALRKALLGGLGANVEAPLARGVAYFRKMEPQYGYDPMRSRQLLAEAGYPNGFSAVMAAPSGRYPKDREIAEALGGQLEAVGVKLTLVPLEWATYLQQVRTEKATTGKRYALSLMAWGNVVGDPDFGLAPFDATGGWNLGGYENRELQGLLERGRVTFDEVKLQAIYGRTQELVWQDAPWIFLVELPVVVALSPKLRGFVPRPDEQIRWSTVYRES